MKIITWNINGIRSLKKSINQILDELNSDVVCFQETKISRNQLPENIALINGYTSYFSYPRKQSGYSGVATYCKSDYVPEDAEEGLSGVLGNKKDDTLLEIFHDFEVCPFDLTELDSEGRVIITYHLIKYADEIRRLAVINVYCPRVDCEKPERHLYKMQFCHLLEAKTKKLTEDGCFVMIVGDLNIACSVIDHCDPGDENEFNSSESRQWLKTFLSSKIGYFNGDVSMMDTFRIMYPDRKDAYTCWNTKTSARLTNYGTRIDYIIVSSSLVPLLLKCDIMSDFEGSDHCPVFAEFKCDSMCDSTAKLPSICTRLWPEFTGKQQTLQSFLKKTQALANDLTKQPVLEIPKNKVKIKNKQKSITSFFKTPKQTVELNNANYSNLTHSFGESNLVSEENANCSQKCTDSTVSENGLIISQSNHISLHCNQNSQISVNNAQMYSDLNVSGKDIFSSSPQNSQVSEWKSFLKGPPKPPMCSGHKKPSVLRTVKKKGPNFGRQFFMCAQPAGHASNPDANCNYFKWVTAPKINILK